MVEKPMEECAKFLEEFKKFGEEIYTFFKEKAPEEKLEKTEIEDRELQEIVEISKIREKREEEILGVSNCCGGSDGLQNLSWEGSKGGVSKWN